MAGSYPRPRPEYYGLVRSYSVPIQEVCGPYHGDGCLLVDRWFGDVAGPGSRYAGAVKAGSIETVSGSNNRTVSLSESAKVKRECRQVFALAGGFKVK